MHIWQEELREPEQNLRALAEQADYPKTDDALRGINSVYLCYPQLFLSETKDAFALKGHALKASFSYFLFSNSTMPQTTAASSSLSSEISKKRLSWRQSR